MASSLSLSKHDMFRLRVFQAVAPLPTHHGTALLMTEPSSLIMYEVSINRTRFIGTPARPPLSSAGIEPATRLDALLILAYSAPMPGIRAAIARKVSAFRFLKL